MRIGLVPSVSRLLFPAVPQLLAANFPRLRVEFHDQTNDSLLLQLENGMIDFGIGALDSSVPESLEIYPLQEDPLWWLCAVMTLWLNHIICRGGN